MVISANAALLTSLAHLPCQDCHSPAPYWQQFSFTIQPPTCLILIIPLIDISFHIPRFIEQIQDWRKPNGDKIEQLHSWKGRLKLFMANNFTRRWDLRWSAIISGCNVLFFLSCCSRLLSKSTEEPDTGEGGRRRANRVQAQDVPLGCGVMAEGHWPSQRKQQVMLMLHIPPELWTSLFFFSFPGSQIFICSSFAEENIHIFLNCCIMWCPLLFLFQLKIVTEEPL